MLELGRGGYFVAVIRGPPGPSTTLLSAAPWSWKALQAHESTYKPLLSSPGIPLPKLNVEGSSPFAHST